MAETNLRIGKDKRESLARRVEVSGFMKKDPKFCGFVCIDDMAEVKEETPPEQPIVPRASQTFHYVGEMPKTGGYIPETAIFPSEEPEEVHEQYAGSEEIIYAR